jgi:hypothetical protein
VFLASKTEKSERRFNKQVAASIYFTPALEHNELKQGSSKITPKLVKLINSSPTEDKNVTTNPPSKYILNAHREALKTCAKSPNCQNTEEAPGHTHLHDQLDPACQLLQIHPMQNPPCACCHLNSASPLLYPAMSPFGNDEKPALTATSQQKIYIWLVFSAQ